MQMQSPTGEILVAESEEVKLVGSEQEQLEMIKTVVNEQHDKMAKVMEGEFSGPSKINKNLYFTSEGDTMVAIMEIRQDGVKMKMDLRRETKQVNFFYSAYQTKKIGSLF